MSASRVLPTWHPIHNCGQRILSGACAQPNTFDRADGLCYFHGKLADLKLGLQTGTESRCRVGNHSPNPRPRYDYAAWFDGQPHTLTWDVDFAADVKSMRRMLQVAARRVDYEITRLDSAGGQHGSVTVCARPKAEAGGA